MRRTAFLMLGLACVLGLLSVYLVRDWINEQIAGTGSAEMPTMALTTVVVARRHIAFGETLVPDVLSEIKWPAEQRPEGTFAKIDELIGEDDGKKRVALRPIEVNEPVLKARVSGFGGRATLSTQISNGNRAVTVRVNDVMGVGGFVLPGDRVDVLLTRQETKGKAATDIILQNIRVLAVDQEANQERNKPIVARAVTLEVTPAQAQKLTLAAQVGQINLALRNHEMNARPAQAETVRVNDLTGETAVVPSVQPVAKAAPRPARRKNSMSKVTIFRALKPTVEQVAPESKSSANAPTPVPSAKSGGATMGQSDRDQGLGRGGHAGPAVGTEVLAEPGHGSKAVAVPAAHELPEADSVASVSASGADTQ